MVGLPYVPLTVWRRAKSILIVCVTCTSISITGVLILAQLMSRAVVILIDDLSIVD